MAREGRWATGVALVCTLFGTVASAAGADGLPVGNVDAGPTGVTAPGDSARYVTLHAGGGTVVARVARAGGQVLRSRFLRGSFTVPAVALDGSAAALSRDGTTLALIGSRSGFPQARTKLLFLDARLRIERRVTLRGDFSFDAISPDGRSAYLIQYLSPRRDPSRYAVRAYDVSAGRLIPEPIVDPREPDERMGGYPISRVSSGDGRWAYTLYDGAGKHPFVHALDTVGRTAACIDLDALVDRKDVFDLRLVLGQSGRRLDVVDSRGGVLAVVNTRTYQVTAAPQAGGDDGGSSQALPLVAAAAGALLLAAAVSVLARRRRRLAPG